jgi:hypothetical protein
MMAFAPRWDRPFGLPVFLVSLLAPALFAQNSVPDITGTWAVNRRGGDPKLVPPAPGPLLLKPQYDGPYKARLAKEKEAEDRGEPLANGSVACVPYGMPQMMSAIYPLEILATKGQVTIIAEAFSEVRRIYLDEPQARIDDVAPGYYGHSVGHWDGGTLMVDTVGIKPSVLGYRGMPHSDQLRIREQFKLVAPDVLWDQVTVEDPVILEKPWTFTFGYRRTPGYKMLEYVCENNREYIDENGVVRLRLEDK